MEKNEWFVYFDFEQKKFYESVHSETISQRLRAGNTRGLWPRALKSGFVINSLSFAYLKTDWY